MNWALVLEEVVTAVGKPDPSVVVLTLARFGRMAKVWEDQGTESFTDHGMASREEESASLKASPSAASMTPSKSVKST